MAKEYKIIGKKVERVDALERLVGEAKYASDIYLPGMLYVKFLRSPHPFAARRSLARILDSPAVNRVSHSTHHGRDGIPRKRH